jgi:heme exporter protein D
MRAHRHLPARTRERGYITLFVLALAALVFLALGTALETNACLHEWNRRQAAQLQARAAEIAVRP